MLGIAPPPSAPAIPPIAPAAQPHRPAAPPAPRQEGLDAEPEWTVALTDEHHEEMRTPEVVELYVRGSIDHETFIWADGMEDWKQPWEIPMIAAALEARGMHQPTGDEPPRSSPLSDEEPDQEEATIVASVDMLPLSGRGKIPSGVWHEPGRDQPEDDDSVGFEDVTVSLDSSKAQQMLQGLANQPAASESEPPPSEDVPTRVESGAEAAGFGAGVDDLLSGMDDPTAAQGAGGFQAVARPLHSVHDFNDDEDTTIDQSHAPRLPNPNAELYAPKLMDLSRPSPVGYTQHPGLPPPNPFAGMDVPSAGRAEPLSSLMGEPPRSMPFPPVSGALEPPKKKSRVLGCLLMLVLFGLLLGAGAAASFYFKQPAELYSPDGRPKLPPVLQKYL